MAQQQAIVHIGTHKTGTTAFQRWASANRAELAEMTGLQYYRGSFNSSHIEFPILCMRTDRSLPMRSEMFDWCLPEWQRDAISHIRRQVEEPCESLLVSAEGLSLLRHTDEVERMVELLRPREVKVVVTLRDPAAYLRSYTQMLEGTGFSRSRYRDSFAYVADDTWLTDYESLLDAYRTVLGSDRVLTLEYEQSLERFGSMIPALMDTLGCEPDSIPRWETYRPSRLRKSKLARILRARRQRRRR